MKVTLTASNPIRTLDSSQYENLVQKEISEFMGIFDMNGDDERAAIIALLENCGVELDGCSHCGAMPMDTNCNNAGCDV